MKPKKECDKDVSCHFYLILIYDGNVQREWKEIVYSKL